MKLHYHSVKKLIIIAGITIFLPVITKEIEVKSANNFDQLVVRHNYALVMVYEFDREIKKDRDLKRKIEGLESMFEDLSDRYKYEEGGLAFLKVNKAKSDLNMISRDLEVKEIPAFFLFEDGELIKDNGKPVYVAGFINRDTLEEFIDNYVGSDLARSIKSKERKRARRRQEAEKESYYAPYYYADPYFYGFYPYAYGYPYGYPYYGVGFYYGSGKYYGGHGGRRYYGGHRGSPRKGMGRGPRGGRSAGRPGGMRSRMPRGGMRAGGPRGGMRSGGMRAGGMRGGSRGGMRGGGMRGGRGGRR